MVININSNILMEMIGKQEELGYEIKFIHGYTIELESGFVDFLSYFGNRLMNEGCSVGMTNITDDWGIFIEFSGPSYCIIRQNNDGWRNEARSLANLIAFGFSKRDLWRSGFAVEPEKYSLLKIYDVKFSFDGEEDRNYNNTFFDLGEGKYLVDNCLVLNANNVAEALYKYLRKRGLKNKTNGLYISKVIEREADII